MTRNLPSFYTRESLQVAVYDVLTTDVPGGDDVGFFRSLALETSGPTLELGCGTGRVTVPIAEAGCTITGVDRSRPMLERAKARRAALPPEVQKRVDLVEADMTTLDLGQTFGLAFAAYRVFMSLPEPEAQRAALDRIRSHLVPGGRLVIDVFDPLLDRFTPGPRQAREVGEARHPTSGNLVRVSSAGRVSDPVSQRFTERFTFRELDEGGEIVREEHDTMSLRWTYRHELHHLLALSGFTVEREISDYALQGPAYGGEIIIIARRAPNT